MEYEVGKTYWVVNLEMASGRGQRINLNLPPTEIVVTGISDKNNTTGKTLWLYNTTFKVINSPNKNIGTSAIRYAKAFDSYQDAIDAYNKLVEDAIAKKRSLITEVEKGIERLESMKLDSQGKTKDKKKEPKEKSTIKL